MTMLSVNINKVATIRNARGGDLPDLIRVALDCERFGADGITVHPRPDERHVRYDDVTGLAEVLTTEFNIEGNPTDRFIELVLQVTPAQVTLVPDNADALTSDAGWDTMKYQEYLTDIVRIFRAGKIRTSIFVGTDLHMIEAAAKTGTDRIELYTGPYAHDFKNNKENAVRPFVDAATLANDYGLGINAGHDLNLDNLCFLVHKIPFLAEVSIGHALISDALYMGLEKTIRLYKEQLKTNII